MTRAVVLALAALALLALADPAGAGVPRIRAGGPTLVVCRPDSAARVRAIWPGRGPRTTRSRRSRLRLLRACRFGELRAAAARAPGGTRILILPGVYREPGGVAIAGRRGVQLQGTGRFARDTIVVGDRRTRDVIRAERADGLAITNLTVGQGAVGDVAVVATDGFRLRKLVVRQAQHSGVAAAASSHGLVENVEAYGNGAAGLDVRGGGCSVEVRDLWAYGNVLGFAGAASVHDSRLVANSAGAESALCARWERNVITANNRNLFTHERQAYCAATPFARRPPRVVCPRVPVPVGTGLLLRGVNRALVRGNVVTGNARAGVRLAWAPATARGVRDPALQFDTSHGNRFLANRLQDNGTDLVWDGEGRGNCWSGNRASTSDPPALPACPQGSAFSAGDPVAQALEVPCATWDPRDNPEPVGCDWFA